MNRHRLPLVVLLALLTLAGCGDGDSDDGDDTAARPAHPCDVVDADAATDLLGSTVTTKRVEDERLPLVQVCSYIPASQDVDAPFLSLQSTPDDSSVDDLLRVLGGDAEHHPVDVPGADEAEAIIETDVAPTVTVIATVDGVVHTVVIGLADVDEAERVAVEAAGLLVAGESGG